MAEDKIPIWGYSRTDAKIFDLAPGESLPDGYVVHPAMIRGTPQEKQMRADAEKEGAPFQFEAKEPAKPAK